MSRPRPGALREILDTPHGALEEAAFVLANDAYPSLALERYRRRLDDLGVEVATLTRFAARPGSAHETAHHIDILREVLYAQAGLRGNADDYHDPRNSYLNDVLDRGLGIPISLAVVVLAVARRAGIAAEGVGFPGHFLVRLGARRTTREFVTDPPGSAAGVLLDPFSELRTLNHADLTTLVRRSLGPTARISPSHLTSCDHRAIVVRMLTNLRAIHEQRMDHRGALVVCDRLVELGAGAPALRDRGMHALALGAGAVAQSDLAAYLAAAPNAPDRGEVERALASAGRRTTWN
ncbi:MAG: transglutaminase-like domain-containing protein [Polyangiaceae bacterium]